MQLWAPAIFGLILATASPAEDTFKVGDWNGRANFNGEGAFTDCTVLLPKPEGTTLGFVMTHGDNLGMLVADPSLSLQLGGEKPVLIHTEGLDTYAAMADIVADNGIIIPLKEDSPVVRAVRDGKEFRVTVREKEFVLQRSGTGKAIEALKGCVETHRGKNRVQL